MIQPLRRDGFTAAALHAALAAQTGESAAWPDDVTFREAWLHKPVYGPMNSPKLVHLYKRLNQTFMSNKAEAVSFKVAPSIEHIMPQNWESNWPLRDGSKGMDFMELAKAPADDMRAAATRARETALQTIGNMTILSTALNTAQSNSAWSLKRPALMKHSLLPINQDLAGKEGWDEEAILERGAMLFERALSLWPR